MSDVEQAVAAPEAAPAAPTTEAPKQEQAPVAPEQGAETPQPEAKEAREAPRTREEARQRTMERAQERRAAREAANATEAQATPASDDAGEVVVDEKGRKHDPATGKFLPENDGKAEAAGEQPKPEGQQDAGSQPAEGYVRVPLPEGHPLRDQGLEYLETRAEQENAIRAAINNPVRRAELEQAQRRERELTERLEQIERQQTHGQIEQKTRQELLSDPDIRARYQDIAATYGEEDAEAFLAGKLRPRIEEAVQQTEAERAQKRMAQTAIQFRNTMYQRAQETLDPRLAALPNFGGLVQRAIAHYGNELDMRERAGQPVQLSEDEFFKKSMLPTLLGDDQALKVLQSIQNERQGQDRQRQEKSATAKAEADAKAREKQRLQEAAQRGKTKHPLGRVPSNVRTGAQSTSAEESQDLSGLDRGSIRKTFRERAGQRR